MCSTLGPAHLLLLDHAPADDLVHRRLRWGTGDRLARVIARTIIGPILDMVFLVTCQFLIVLMQWRRRLPRASQNNKVVLGTLQPGTSSRRIKDVAPLASATGVLDAARFC